MENQEINRYRPDVHDCNECKRCQGCIKNNRNNNNCRACWFIFFEKHYKDFSSGNDEVDEMIKNPIYFPPKKNNYEGSLNYYEWIPWERLLNINEIARGGLGIIYKATIIDGLIDERSIKHHGEMEYKRGKFNEDEERIDEVAIKIIPTNSLEVFKELNIQRAMFIKNGYFGYVSSILGITQNAETLEYGIVMEFAEHGDIRKYLSKNFHSIDSISFTEKRTIAFQIALGLEEIHDSGMVHRNLHSGNILQYKSMTSNTRICDLRLCQPTNNEATTTKEKKIYGVIPYIPPEVLRGEKFTVAGDIYSFAMLLWELATGKPPFYDRSHDLFLVMDILYNGIRPKITSPLIPPSYAEIIVKCWDVNPENRPTAREVYEMLNELTFSESEFWDSDNYVKEMVKNDSTTNHSTTTITHIHPGAVYTSRLFTLQIIEETKEFVYMPEYKS
ncbi:hypothetical protein G9A89_008332 [Geosiphon pyriformis]|nr:hypothetical protein G9A89_008332 [Geosiphon pyriformis]